MNKEFNNIEEIISDNYFQSNLRNVIKDLKNKRLNRPLPPAGFKYKRDWYDRYDDCINADYFSQHIKAIWLKKSNLNAELRSIILYCCELALEKTIQIYNDLEKTNTEHQTTNTEQQTLNNEQL